MVVGMLKTYRSPLSIPHARAFVLAGSCVANRLSTGSPRLGRLVDRYGQRRTLLVSLAVHSAGTLALVISTQLSAPNWILLATAALSGAAALQVGSLVRARWSALVGGSPALGGGVRAGVHPR